MNARNDERRPGRGGAQVVSNGNHRQSSPPVEVGGGDLVIVKPGPDGRITAEQADSITCTPGMPVLVLILGAPTAVSDDAGFYLGVALAHAGRISVWGPVTRRFRADVARGVAAARADQEQESQRRLRAARLAGLGYSPELNAAAEHYLRRADLTRKGAA